MMLNSKAEDYHQHHYYKVSLLNQLIQMNYVIRCLEIFVINQQEQQQEPQTVSQKILVYDPKNVEEVGIAVQALPAVKFQGTVKEGKWECPICMCGEDVRI